MVIVVEVAFRIGGDMVGLAVKSKNYVTSTKTELEIENQWSSGMVN